LVSGDGFAVQAVTDARFTLFAGVPIAQDIHPGWPFVGSGPAEILAFRARFASGGMGRLLAFDQAAMVVKCGGALMQ
jgi:redox-sensitive bicupin YhaK (pirin superfamily)